MYGDIALLITKKWFAFIPCNILTCTYWDVFTLQSKCASCDYVWVWFYCIPSYPATAISVASSHVYMSETVWLTIYTITCTHNFRNCLTRTCTYLPPVAAPPMGIQMVSVFNPNNTLRQLEISWIPVVRIVSAGY